jgi:hypothetical protein
MAQPRFRDFAPWLQVCDWQALSIGELTGWRRLQQLLEALFPELLCGANLSRGHCTAWTCDNLNNGAFVAPEK